MLQGFVYKGLVDFLREAWTGQYSNAYTAFFLPKNWVSFLKYNAVECNKELE